MTKIPVLKNIIDQQNHRLKSYIQVAGSLQAAVQGLYSLFFLLGFIYRKRNSNTKGRNANKKIRTEIKKKAE
jgi:hypothetical protein